MGIRSSKECKLRGAPDVVMHACTLQPLHGTNHRADDTGASQRNTCMHAGCKCEHTNPHTQAETTQPQEQHHCRASQHDSSSNTDQQPPPAAADGITTAVPTHTPSSRHRGYLPTPLRAAQKPLHRLPTHVTTKPTASRCKSTRNAAQNTQTGAQHRPPTFWLLFHC